MNTPQPIHEICCPGDEDNYVIATDGTYIWVYAERLRETPRGMEEEVTIIFPRRPVEACQDLRRTLLERIHGICHTPHNTMQT